MVFFGNIPIRIHPFFWVIAALIGWISSRSIYGMAIWIFIILVSVLVHELGHAITARLFGLHPKIELIALGGVTSYEAKDVPFWKQFIIVFNGPFFGMLLFGLASLLLMTNLTATPIVFSIVKTFQIVNLFWSIINLIPVLPLDGGQLLRITLEGFMGIKGFKLSLFIGMLISLTISLLFFYVGYFLVGALFFLFAFQSFDAWRKSKHLSMSDRKAEYADHLMNGEKAFQAGQKEEAKKIFSKVREETKEGMVFVTATHDLAVVEYEDGQKHKAYELLHSVKDHLSEDALCFLQKIAFDEKDYQLVSELSSMCYQRIPTEEVALRNAKAFANLKKAKPAGGWLQTALQFGRLDMAKVLSDSDFASVREDPAFQHFFKKK